MRITILSHNLSSNAAMRAHRLALAARHFAEVSVIGLVKSRGLWGALPNEPWIHPVGMKNFPKFFKTTIEIIAASNADVLIAVKPFLASYGVSLLAAECRKIPVILDLDDLDVQLAPKIAMTPERAIEELRDPGSSTYLRLLSRATSLASAISVASTRLQARFGGTLVPHGCPTEQFNPNAIDRKAARKTFGFEGPVELFTGTRRIHKGLKQLAKAFAKIPRASLALLCRPQDFSQPDWAVFPLIKIPIFSYSSLPTLLAAADVVAIPQLDTEVARHQMPMKVYDAMAMGKPIVATTVSDLPIALENCAMLVPPKDVESLASAIIQLLENPAAARDLGERARARCLEKYSMRQVADALQKVVTHAVESHNNLNPA